MSIPTSPSATHVLHELANKIHHHPAPSAQDFPFGYQGKQLSQLTAFIWRWADSSLVEPTQDQKKHNAALDLLNNYYLYRDEKGAPSSKKLKDLFAANPRQWIHKGRDPKSELAHECELLITVFGEHRIRNEKMYLSPMFTPEELGLGSDEIFVHYHFLLDPNTFMGYVSDAYIHYNERAPRFDYHIAFPPRPQVGDLTVTAKELEDWVDNDNTRQILPHNLFIPSSTS